LRVGEFASLRVRLDPQTRKLANYLLRTRSMALTTNKKLVTIPSKNETRTIVSRVVGIINMVTSWIVIGYWLLVKGQ
jgi:hypothetical protein